MNDIEYKQLLIDILSISGFHCNIIGVQELIPGFVQIVKNCNFPVQDPLLLDPQTKDALDHDSLVILVVEKLPTPYRFVNGESVMSIICTN
jgi:hypothetical protein